MALSLPALCSTARVAALLRYLGTGVVVCGAVAVVFSFAFVNPFGSEPESFSCVPEQRAKRRPI